MFVSRENRRRWKNDCAGFSLIELLIVIIILGLLAAIVVFAVQDLTNRGSTTACQAQYKTIETALEEYKAQTGVYPAANDFGALLTTTSSIDGNGNVGPWLRDEPPVSSSQGSDWFGFGADGSVIVYNTATPAGGSISDCK